MHYSFDHDIIIHGSLVKRLRRRPLTAETRVRFPYGLLSTCIYCKCFFVAMHPEKLPVAGSVGGRFSVLPCNRKRCLPHNKILIAGSQSLRILTWQALIKKKKQKAICFLFSLIIAFKILKYVLIFLLHNIF